MTFFMTAIAIINAVFFLFTGNIVNLIGFICSVLVVFCCLSIKLKVKTEKKKFTVNLDDERPLKLFVDQPDPAWKEWRKQYKNINKMIDDSCNPNKLFKSSELNKLFENKERLSFKPLNRAFSLVNDCSNGHFDSHALLPGVNKGYVKRQCHCGDTWEELA